MAQMAHFARYSQLHLETHGNFPTSWEELERVSGNYDWEAEPNRLRLRIAFVEETVIMDNPYHGGRIVAISRDTYRPQSFYLSRWTGRVKSRLMKPSYTVFVERKGEIHFRNMPPDMVARIFKTAGAKLPEPSGLGPYPHEMRARREQVMEFIIISAFISAISVWITRMILRHRKKMAG